MSIRRIFLRRDTAANFTSANPVLSEGEPAFDTTNQILKVGDGVTAWNSLAQLYDIAGINANATAISAHSTRLTNLETYSPLGSGTGTVTGITWRNLTELALAGEKITNGNFTLSSGSGSSNFGISGLSLWFDSLDSSTLFADTSFTTSVTSAVGGWRDKSGNNYHATQSNSSYQPNLINGHLNNSPVVRFDGSNDFLNLPGSITLQTFFFVLNSRDGPTFVGWDWPMGGITSSSNKKFVAFARANNNDINGDNLSVNGGSTGASVSFAPLSAHKILKVVFNYPATRSDWKIGDGDSNWHGDFAEIIGYSGTLSTLEIQNMEGYLAHKWGIESDLPTNHPYYSTAPSFQFMPGWSTQSGSWSNTDMTNGVLTGAVTIRQNVNLGSGGVYDVTLDRTDTNTSLTSKVKTSHAVTWLSHANAVATEADVAHDGTARFEVTGTVPTYIELDTIDSSRTLTSVSMTQSVLAGGTVQAGNNGTLEKIAGADAWNAGASSTEYIGGQNEGYVQFQIAQTGKDIKTGLVYADVDYGDADPFEMTFSGTDVSIGGSNRTTYISGDWFRIRHDSSNNQIVYQKRQTTSNGLEYVTFYTDPTTTNGSNLYFDTSFYHLNGRINDVTMVV